MKRKSGQSEMESQWYQQLKQALERYRSERGQTRRRQALDDLGTAAAKFIDYERMLLNHQASASRSRRKTKSRWPMIRFQAHVKVPEIEPLWRQVTKSSVEPAWETVKYQVSSVEPVWATVKLFLQQHKQYWLIALAIMSLIGLMLTTGSQHETLARYTFYLLATSLLLVAYTTWRRIRRVITIRWGANTWALLYFAALALLILGSLLKPSGYILILDTVWGPHHYLGLKDSVSPQSLAPLQAVIFVLRALFGATLSQSIFIFTILTLTGWLTYNAIPFRRFLVKFWAGTFYLLNPFVYDRLMAGQWVFLLGYAVLPKAVWATYRLLRQPTWKHSLAVAAWWTVATIASFHFLYIFGLFFLVALPIGLLAVANKKRFMAVWLGTSGLYLLFNLYWIVPLLLSAPALEYVDWSHLTAFATRPDIVDDVWLSALLLHGFFGQKGVSAASVVPAAAWLFLPILGLAIYGVLVAMKQRLLRDFTLVLTISAYLAILLAVGVSAFGARELFLWLFDHLPGFTAMREPQKFLALLAVWYAFFTAFGLAVALDYLQRAWQQVAVLLTAIILVVLQVLPMLGGTGGQLHRVDYPAGWYKTRQILNESTQGAVLVLPWKQYLHLPFAYNDKLVANPALVMFDQPLYVSRRIDTPGVTDQPDRPIDAVADRLDRGELLSEADYWILKDSGVRWIVVLSAPRKPDLANLSASPRLVMKYQDQDITLFRVLGDS